MLPRFWLLLAFPIPKLWLPLWVGWYSCLLSFWYYSRRKAWAASVTLSGRLWLALQLTSRPDCASTNSCYCDLTMLVGLFDPIEAAERQDPGYSSLMWWFTSSFQCRVVGSWECRNQLLDQGRLAVRRSFLRWALSLCTCSLGKGCLRGHSYLISLH